MQSPPDPRQPFTAQRPRSRTFSVPLSAGPTVLERRRVLGGLGAAALLTITGCAGGSELAGAGAGEAAESAGSPSPSSGSPSATGTETASPAPTTMRTEPPLEVDAARRYTVGAPVVIAYGGEHRRQYGELIVPQGLPEEVKVPVLMILHGGSWQATSTLGYLRDVARNMASYGVATWNVEYRGIGGGGGWPNTFADVAAAMDFVPGLAEHIGRRIDRERFFLAGHSAGGHLAAWAASRHLDESEQPGGRPALRPAACVSFAGVYDLAYAQRLGHRHMVNLLGGTPSQVPHTYELASPIRNIPEDVEFVCCHSSNDAVVPVAQTANYAAASEDAGHDAESVILPSAGHVDWVIPGSRAWAVGQEQLLEVITAVRP